METNKYISQKALKADNVENPVFFPPNLYISAADLSAAERYRPSPEDKQERGIMYGWRGGTHTSHAHGGKLLSGD